MLGKSPLARSRQIQRGLAKYLHPIAEGAFIGGLCCQRSENKVGAAPVFGGDLPVRGKAFRHAPCFIFIAAVQGAKRHGQSNWFGSRLPMTKDDCRRYNANYDGQVDRQDQRQPKRIGH